MYILSRFLTAITYKPLLDGILAVLMSTPSRPRSEHPQPKSESGSETLQTRELRSPQKVGSEAETTAADGLETKADLGAIYDGGENGEFSGRAGHPSSGGEATTAGAADEGSGSKPLRRARSSR